MSSSSSTTDPAAAGPPERIEVGRVVRPHGVRGEVVVESFSDVPGRFAAGARLEIVGARGEKRNLIVRSAAPPKSGHLVVAFESIDTRDSAETLRGARIEVGRSEVPKAPDGEFWIFDLVGCRAHDERAGELGVVTDVVDAGAGPLLVVELADGRRVPLPFVERFLIRVDPAERRIEWRLPEGLIEACASRS